MMLSNLSDKSLIDRARTDVSSTGVTPPEMTLHYQSNEVPQRSGGAHLGPTDVVTSFKSFATRLENFVSLKVNGRVEFGTDTGSILDSQDCRELIWSKTHLTTGKTIPFGR